MAKKTNLKRRSKEYKKDGYYKDYEERRKNAGKNARIKYKNVRRQVKKFVRKNTEYGNRTRFLMVMLVMARYNLSYRGMVEELDWNKMQRRRLGFSRTPSKSCLWWNRNQLPTNLLDELLAFTAGAGASGTLLADSSSYTYNRYEWRETAKGAGWVRSTIKHHVLLTLDGCVASSAVTDGSRDDSPMLLKLTGTIPAGSGYLLADRKYCCMGELSGGPPHGQAALHETTQTPRRGRFQRMGPHDPMGEGGAWQVLPPSSACATWSRVDSRRSRMHSATPSGPSRHGCRYASWHYAA